MDQRYLLDPNLYKTISKCYINKKRPDRHEVHVIYTDNTKETIWTFNPMRHDFDHCEFVGKTKIDAVFHCDRKEPRSIQLF